MEQETKTEKVEMTPEMKAQFEAFRKAQEKKAAEEQRKADMAAYNELVNETIERAMPILSAVSENIAEAKQHVIDQFRDALNIKGDLFEVKDDQRSHTFTNAKGDKRIMLGYYMRDDYRDTVEEGIAIVREAIESLGKDDESRALVQAVLRLLSRDQKGTLKASRVLQLQKLAEDSRNERFQQGVKIIRDSYQPTKSKQFIRAEQKDENGEWKPVVLGMTEA